MAAVSPQRNDSAHPTTAANPADGIPPMPLAPAAPATAPETRAPSDARFARADGREKKDVGATCQTRTRDDGGGLGRRD